MERRRLLLVAGLLAIFCGLLAAVVPIGHPVDVDLAVAGWVVAHRTDAGITAFLAITMGGWGAGLFAIAALLALYLRRRGGWRPIGWLALAMTGGPALYWVLNRALARPRPPMGTRLLEDTSWSFPSGHSTQAAAFWFVAAVLATADRGPRAQRLARAAALAITLAIGVSRIYLGQHWLTDVCGGLSLGGAWAAFVLALRARYDGGAPPTT